MTTIRDEIDAWARTNIQGATVMTRNTDAYNHMQAAVAELLEKPWANLVLGADMKIASPADILGKAKAADDANRPEGA